MPSWQRHAWKAGGHRGRESLTLLEWKDGGEPFIFFFHNSWKWHSLVQSLSDFFDLSVSGVVVVVHHALNSVCQMINVLSSHLVELDTLFHGLFRFFFFCSGTKFFVFQWRPLQAYLLPKIVNMLLSCSLKNPQPGRCCLLAHGCQRYMQPYSGL